MIFAKSGVAVVVIAAGALEAAKEGATLLVLFVAAIGSLWAIYKRVVQPVLRGAHLVEQMFTLVAGDEDRPGIDARVEGLEREMSRFAKLMEGLHRITDLARDEHVADVRDLIRRGQVPQPPLEERRRGEPW